MNSILTTYFKSTVVNAGKLMRYQVATFATAKAKVEATPAKSKKASTTMPFCSEVCRH